MDISCMNTTSDTIYDLYQLFRQKQLLCKCQVTPSLCVR